MKIILFVRAVIFIDAPTSERNRDYSQGLSVEKSRERSFNSWLQLSFQFLVLAW